MIDSNRAPLKIEVRPTDFVMGDGHITLGSLVPSGNWVSHFEFFENQDLGSWGDTNDCVCFAAQEAFDAQMDLLLQTASADFVSQIAAMGFLDKGNDGARHFHSSPRFLGALTGNGTNGNSTQEVFDVMRAFGCLPWAALPYDATVSEADYFTHPNPAHMALAAKFLALLGGKQAIQYHQISQGSPKNFADIQKALQQAPIEIGVAVAQNWNQVTPSPDPSRTAAPQHCVAAYALIGETLSILDHYVPYEKILDPGYPINYISQLIVTLPTVPVPQPLPPVIAPTQQNVTVLQAIVAIYQQLINLIKGRKQ